MASTTSQFNIQFNAVLKTSDLESDIKKFQNKKVNINMKDTNKQVSESVGLFDALSNKAQHLSQTFADVAANQLVSTGLRVLRQGISDAIEEVVNFDAVLIEFRKVSDITGESLDNYIEKAAQLGETVGRSASEMIQAATEFRKNSFNDEDSLILARVATEFQNISDEAISASDSASIIISVMKAFNIEAQNAESIIDKINEV